MVLALGCILVSPLALAVNIDILIDPPVLLRVDTFFYDETGHAGLVNPSFPYFPIPRAKTEIFFTGDPQLAMTFNAAYYPPDISPVPPGTPFAFRIALPTLGVFEGSSYVAAIYPSALSPYQHYLPHFVIPMTPAALGHALEMQSRPATDPPPPNGQFEGVSITLNVASQQNGATYTTDFHAVPQATTPKVTITVDYLPGCSLAYLGRQTGIITSLYDRGTRRGVDPTLSWSGYPDEYRTASVRLGSTAPLGPIQIAVSVDGFTTDTVRFSGENLTHFTWNALLFPLPPPQGGDQPEGLTFVQTVVSVFGQIREAIEGRIAPAPAMDQNQDGAVDAADLVQFLYSSQSSPGGLSR